MYSFIQLKIQEAISLLFQIHWVQEAQEKFQFQVLRLIAQGHSLASSGKLLDISEFTVRRHKHNTMKKLNLSDEASLVRFALEKGVVKFKGGLDWTEVTHQKH